MSEIDDAAEQGRVAILAIDFRALHALCGDAIDQDDRPRWEGDVWVEPEVRFNIGRLITECSVPPFWHIARRPFMPGIYVDPVAGRLCVLFASDSFPVTPQGMFPPHITPVFETIWQDDHQERVFSHWDMREVMERSDVA